MNLWTYITIFVLALTLTCGQKKTNQYDEDEKRPYEFGFNIDGQQHRHEAKDSKGIVTGEFGFITADGVYHVTVYATDEEGRFKIISMKSIKVSPPLDGSGDQTPVKSPATSERPHPNSPSPTPPPHYTPPPPQYTPPPHLAQFTTHKPLLLPSCGSCSIPSTVKPPPGSKPNQFTFQTSAFKPKPPKSPPNAVPPSTPAKYPAHIEYPNNPPETISNEVLPPFQQQPSKPFYPLQPSISTQPSQPFYPSKPSVPSQQFNPSKPSSPSQFNPSSVPAKPQAPKQPSIPQDAFFPGLIHPQYTGNEQSSPVIEGQMPPGVTTDDMLHLLYKFNYTLGFHGHYETGYRNGAKIGGYFVNGRDGISRIVEYVADENGYRPKILYLKLGLDSPDTPKEGNEKDFEVKGRIFEWYSLR